MSIVEVAFAATSAAAAAVVAAPAAGTALDPLAKLSIVRAEMTTGAARLRTCHRPILSGCCEGRRKDKVIILIVKNEGRSARASVHSCSCDTAARPDQLRGHLIFDPLSLSMRLRETVSARDSEKSMRPEVLFNFMSSKRHAVSSRSGLDGQNVIYIQLLHSGNCQVSRLWKRAYENLGLPARNYHFCVLRGVIDDRG